MNNFKTYFAYLFKKNNSNEISNINFSIFHFCISNFWSYRINFFIDILLYTGRKKFIFNSFDDKIRIIPILENYFVKNSESRELSRNEIGKKRFSSNTKCYSNGMMIRRLSDTDLNGTSDTGAFWNNVMLSSNVPSTQSLRQCCFRPHQYSTIPSLVRLTRRSTSICLSVVNLYTVYDIYIYIRERDKL